MEAGGAGDETGDRLDAGAVGYGEDICCRLENFAEEEGCFTSLSV